MKSTTKTVDLSIDFDFFCRVLSVKWDLGHHDSDSPLSDHFLTALWAVRYHSIDLYEECCIDKHADFPPEDLLVELGWAGLDLVDPEERTSLFCESHRHAWPFFHEQWSAHNPPHALIQLDAHHDLYGEYRRAEAPDHLHCGNWLAKLMDTWDRVPVVQLYPAWLSPDRFSRELSSASRTQNITFARYNDFSFDHYQGAEIRNIFVCRSGQWTPPHLDHYFLNLLRAVGSEFKHTFGDRIIVRDDVAPSYDEAKTMLSNYNDLVQGRIAALAEGMKQVQGGALAVRV